MTTKYFKGTAAAMLLMSVAATTPVLAAETPTAATGDFSLTVFHTNDTHANLATTAERAALVKKLKAEKPYNVLLDAGDVFSGTLYFNEFEGQADLAIMNYLGYDAMTFGNHEFDLGGSEEGHKHLPISSKVRNSHSSRRTSISLPTSNLKVCKQVRSLPKPKMAKSIMASLKK